MGRSIANADVVIERPAPPVVRERIIERNYYYEAEPAPPVQAYAPTYYSYAPAYLCPAYYAYAPGCTADYGYDDGYRWRHRRASLSTGPIAGITTLALLSTAWRLATTSRAGVAYCPGQGRAGAPAEASSPRRSGKPFSAGWRDLRRRRGRPPGS
jgi:hypothetical protein